MIVVSGYHGYDNLGDEAILHVLCQNLVELGWQRSDITVLSHAPQKTSEQYGVNSINRYDLSAVWHALGQSAALISGGGSLLQDVTSKRTIPYYLGVVEMARKRGVPYLMYAQGLGPVSSNIYAKWIARAFKKSAAFTVRDSQSAKFLDENGVTVPQSAVAVDPVFQLWNPSSGHSKEVNGGARIVVNLRPFPQWRQDKSTWVKILSQLCTMGHSIMFAPLGPGDADIGQELQAEVPEVDLLPQLSLANYQGVFEQADVCLTMRLHGVILSAVSNVVPIAFNYDPKVHAICEQLGSRCVELVEIEILPYILPDVLQRYPETLYAQNEQLTRLHKIANFNRDILPACERGKD